MDFGQDASGALVYVHACRCGEEVQVQSVQDEVPSLYESILLECPDCSFFLFHRKQS